MSGWNAVGLSVDLKAMNATTVDAGTSGYNAEEQSTLIAIIATFSVLSFVSSCTLIGLSLFHKSYKNSSGVHVGAFFVALAVHALVVRDEVEVHFIP